MKTIFYTFLACLMFSCVSKTTEEKTENTKNEAVLSKKDSTQQPTPETSAKKPTLSKKDSTQLNVVLSPKIIPQDRDIIELIQDSDSVVVVAHVKLWAAKTVGDSIKAVQEKVTLTPQQRILFVKTLNKNAKITIRQVKEDCWYPRHNVYFYTKQGIAYWQICFECNKDRSAGISFLNASNVNLEEGGIIAKLFKKFGLTYHL